MVEILKLDSIRAEPEFPICTDRSHRFQTVRVPVEIEHPPPPEPLTWTIDGIDRPDLEDRNEVRITFRSGGVRSVVARDETGEVSMNPGVNDTPRIVIETDPPMAQGQTRLAITAEPKMPEIRASAVISNGIPTSELKWTGFVDFRGQNCPPSQLGFMRFELPLLIGQGGILDFGGKIRGGFLVFFAEASFNSPCASQVRAAFEGPFIDGTNPPRSAIQAALLHNTLRRIACKESGQRQFDAPPDGGVGPCPLFGVDGVRVGVMQIPNPTDDEIWNWRSNVDKGIEIFNKGVDTARAYPNKVRNSERFQALVVQSEFLINQKREQEGLAPIQVFLSDFTGDFDDVLQPLALDAIRGYNGFHGEDQRFGIDELHEFRVAVDIVNGGEVLRVTNINEQTLMGEAVWERVPVADRPAEIGDPHYDPDYVNNVLSFLSDCSPNLGTPVTPGSCGATLRFLDFQNHEIDPNIQALSVSNHVSNDLNLRGVGIGFPDHTTDPDAFRLEVEDSTAGASVEVVLQVGGRDPRTYQLNQKSGNRYRGPFLRLVSDLDDELSLPTSQNIFCVLGEKVLLRYTKPPAFDCEDRHEIQIGRPVGENNNDHPSHLRHDIRELKLNVVVFSRTGTTSLDGAINAGRTTIKVQGLADAHNAGSIKIDDEIIRYTGKSVGSRTFRECVRGAEGTVATAHANGAQVLYSTTTPVATRVEVDADLATVDQRFAQSGIMTRKPIPINPAGEGDPGVVLPSALLGGYLRTGGTYGLSAGQLRPTATETAVAALKDADVNSIDIFYVDRIFEREAPAIRVRATARRAGINNTGLNVFQNFVVLSNMRSILSIAHEIMHILLDSSHRLPGEPATAIFHPTRNDIRPDSTKRIGPYPDADATGVGPRDTETIRANAETLPS